MNSKNQKILIILVSAFILVSVYTYSARGVLTPGEGGGSIILMDKDVSSGDPSAYQNKILPVITYLRTENCEASVTYCSYAYEEGVNANADINKDGKIDLIDLRVVVRNFGISSSDSTKWNAPVEDCYFDVGGRKFKDPSSVKNYPNVDCNITMADVDIFRNAFGSSGISPYCEVSSLTDACASDINKDGKVDMLDLAIMLSRFGEYADHFERYVEHASQGDIDGDGKIDMRDIGDVAANYGEDASHQTCQTKPLTHISGLKYGTDISGLGLYYAVVNYRCW